MSSSIPRSAPSYGGTAAVAAAVAAAVVGGCGGGSGLSYAPGSERRADGGADVAARPAEPPAPRASADSEDYTDYGVRPFVAADRDRLSTFSIDVDTGSYTIARRKLREGLLPPAAAVRVEEFVNYFRQDYPDPDDGAFAVVSEAAPSPFRADRTAVRIGLQGRRVDEESRRRANLVFLVDVSGSMQSPDKIGLVKRSLRILVENLRPDDTVAICTYAGRVATVLEPTPVEDRAAILAALDGLEAGGSTAMASGLLNAYGLARRLAGPGASTRVLVCSDGDANVGASSHREILDLIADYRGRGITLGAVGFGMGNYKDTMMEQLADRGDGSYAYIDGVAEARRLFGEELTASLETIARDVKVQVAFDPERVARYRLLGYENRAIHDDAFRDDEVDAGEVGAGHTVTAVYEVELVAGSTGPLGEVRLRYADAAAFGGEPAVHERACPLPASVRPSFAAASPRFRLTVCAAEFAEILRESPHSETRLVDLLPLVEESLGARYDERDHELLELVRRAAGLDRGGAK